MRSPVYSILLVLFAFTLGACRQADGPLPARDGEVPNRLDDIARDLMGAAAGDRQASTDLADDLSVFAEARGDAAARALSQRVADAVAGSQLKDDSAHRLAQQLWTGVAGRQMSERQVAALQDDVRALLVSVGVMQPDADAVASQLADMQKAVTARSRRWYERF